MSERILWAAPADLNAAAASLPWPETTYMYLERGLRAWLNEEEIADGVRLERYDRSINLQPWDKGRIFCRDFELRWERWEEGIAAILLGAAPPAEGFQEEPQVDLAGADVDDRRYFLWGLKVEDSDRAAVGVEHPQRQGSGEPFLELRIPRVLRYPLTGERRQALLNVREYRDRATGAVLHYRLTGVEER
jgi:hypothetical protein